MIYEGNGRFSIEPNDWGHIVTWPSCYDYRAEIWEKPILSPEVAQWFSNRDNVDISLILNSDQVSRSIVINDPYLATEFRLRWCRQYEICFGKDVWRFCDPNFQGITSK